MIKPKCLEWLRLPYLIRLLGYTGDQEDGDEDADAGVPKKPEDMSWLTGVSSQVCFLSPHFWTFFSFSRLPYKGKKGKNVDMGGEGRERERKTQKSDYVELSVLLALTCFLTEIELNSSRQFNLCVREREQVRMVKAAIYCWWKEWTFMISLVWGFGERRAQRMDGWIDGEEEGPRAMVAADAAAA